MTAAAAWTADDHDRLGRLGILMEAHRQIVAELSLDRVVGLVVESARDIARAQGAALVIGGPDGRLDQRVHRGMDDATLARLDQLEAGGLLEASSGAPLISAAARSFLSVPVHTTGSGHATLHLADRIGAAEFSAEDEQLALALATTAGIAIENARLYQQASRRQEWLRASAEISRRLLEGDDSHEVLTQITDVVRRLSDSQSVSLILPVNGTADDPEGELLQVEVSSGAGEGELPGLRYPRADSVAGEAMRTGRGLLITDLDEHPGYTSVIRRYRPVQHIMGFPLRGDGPARGAILATRDPGDPPFTEVDLELAESFAVQAALALDCADATRDRHQLEVLEDRSRIARDLHDHVVQRLYAAGLTLQSTSRNLDDEQLKGQLSDTVSALDETIRRIRASIFELQDVHRQLDSVRVAVLDAIQELTPLLGCAPEVRFVGPLDTVVDPRLRSELVSVVQMALGDLAQDVRGQGALVELSTGGRQLTLVVADGESPVGTSFRRTTIEGLRARAAAHDGSLDVERSDHGGCRLRWRVSLDVRDGSSGSP